MLDGEAVVVGLDVGIETCYIGRVGCDFHTGVTEEYFLIEVFGQSETFGVVDHISCKECHTPCATFASCLHDRDRRVEGGSKYALSHTFGLEKTTVASEAVDGHILFFEKDVVAEFEDSYSGIEVCTHEVGEVEAVVCRADEEL